MMHYASQDVLTLLCREGTRGVFDHGCLVAEIMSLSERALDAHVQRIPGKVEIGNLVVTQVSVEIRVREGACADPASDDELSFYRFKALCEGAAFICPSTRFGNRVEKTSRTLAADFGVAALELTRHVNNVNSSVAGGLQRLSRTLLRLFELGSIFHQSVQLADFFVEPFALELDEEKGRVGARCVVHDSV